MLWVLLVLAVVPVCCGLHGLGIAGLSGGGAVLSAESLMSERYSLLRRMR